MKACVRHWKVDYEGFSHHFLDFRRFPAARLEWGYDCIIELVRHPNACVRRTNWQTVLNEAGGAKPVLVRERRVDLDRVFQRARRQLNRQRYHFYLYNCEHFANECMLGVRRSRQVRARTMQAVTSVFSGAGTLVLLQQPDLESHALAAAASMGAVCVVCGAIFARFVIRSTRAVRRLRRCQHTASGQATAALAKC